MIPATSPYAPTPVLALLYAAAGLLTDSTATAAALVREIERDLPSLTRRPAQLVRAAGARPADLARLVRAAGFTDLDAVREQAVRETGAGDTRPSVAATRAPDRFGVDGVVRRETTALTDTLTTARASGALELAAGEILASRRRWVFGDLHSRGFAQLFAADLSASLGQVTLVEPTASGVLAAIGDVQRRDSLTVFTFRPYSRLAGRLVRHFDEHGATVVTITDDANPATDSTHVLRVLTAGDDASSTAAVALASTLAELATAGAKGAQRRIEKQRSVAAELEWHES